jgi:hypothetical protein
MKGRPKDRDEDKRFSSRLRSKKSRRPGQAHLDLRCNRIGSETLGPRGLLLSFRSAQRWVTWTSASIGWATLAETVCKPRGVKVTVFCCGRPGDRAVHQDYRLPAKASSQPSLAPTCEGMARLVGYRLSRLPPTCGGGRMVCIYEYIVCA